MIQPPTLKVRTRRRRSLLFALFIALAAIVVSTVPGPLDRTEDASAAPAGTLVPLRSITAILRTKDSDSACVKRASPGDCANRLPPVSASSNRTREAKEARRKNGVRDTLFAV